MLVNEANLSKLKVLRQCIIDLEAENVEIAELKKENAKLRKENTELRRIQILE